MPQDEKTKQAYEHTDKMEKQERAEAAADRQVNDAALRGDQHTGEQGVLRTDKDSYDASLDKDVYDMLPDFTKDELHRLRLVPRGTRLKTGGVYFDIRNPAAGELTAKGEEEVHDELLVAKRDVDYEIWDKLLGRVDRLSNNTP